MRIPKNSQIRQICISGALFLFYAPRFFECEKIVLNCFSFLIYMQKPRTEVRGFCLHLFCQCKLERVPTLEVPVYRFTSKIKPQPSKAVAVWRGAATK